MSNVVRHVLVADADPQGASHAAEALGGFDVETIATVPAMLERIVGTTFDLVLLDPGLGDDDDNALALLHRVRTMAPDTVVVIWSARPTVEFTVRAMRSGALDVLHKEAATAEIRSVVERAIQHGALAREVRRLRGEVERARGLGEVIGESPLMRQLLQMIERVAANSTPVSVASMRKE